MNLTICLSAAFLILSHAAFCMPIRGQVKGGRKIQAAVYNSAPRRFSEPLHTTDCRSIRGKAAFADRPRPGGASDKARFGGAAVQNGI